MFVYSFIVFKYAYTCEFNPTERIIHFRENWLKISGSWEEAECRDLRSKRKYFRGAEDFFRYFGRSMHYYKGERELRHPPGGPYIHI